MRKLFCVLVILLNVCWVNIALAQNTNPNYGIFFQAVARDNFSNPAKDRVVFVESSILQFTANGTKVLTELHQTTTDGLGVFSINIGSGQRIGGTLSGLDKVDWANGPYFLGLKIAIKPISPVSNWDYTKELIDLGASSFGTVPYAYYAGNSAVVKDVVKTTDTSAMLLPYAKASTLQQTNTNLGLKVNIADSTTIYVTPTQLRAVKFDTTAIYSRLSEREVIDNKSLNVTTDATSDTKYPSVRAIKSYVDLQFSNFVLADGSVTAAKIANGAVTDAKITSVSGSKVTGDIAGNAATATLAANATKLATPRTINGVAFDGSSNITIATGSTVTDANATTKGVVQLAGDLTGTAAQPVVAANAITTSKIADGAVTDAKINAVAGSKVTGDIAGNAATSTLAANATKLATPRTINGVAFDGSSNITIATGSNLTDATAISKGIVQLAGDLTGTATQPVVAANAITTSKIADGAVTDAKINTVAGSKVTGTVALANGGTGATTAAGARTNLGLVIGTDILAQRTFGSAANNNTNDFVATAEKGSNNGVATLGNDGKIPSAQIPAVSFQSATVVSSQAAMLALNSAVVGSIAIRTDNNKNYVLSALPAITLVNWIELATPSSVTSVNGFAGPNVVLTAADVNGVEVALNKSSNIINDAQSTTKYPSVKAIKDYVDQQSSNAGVADNSITSNKINGTIAITKGGTGATNAADARTNLGLVIGTDVMSATATTTLTGDVAGSGNGTIATTINNVGGVSSNTISTFDTRITSNTSSITTNTANILLKAPINSPAFTGTPTAPTPATSDNSTKVATTEYVKNSIIAANAGISSIGNIAGTSNVKGATISGTTELILTPADATNGGILTSGAQTIAGAKTFSNDVIAPNFVGNLTGNATTATTAGNITATSNSTLTSLPNLNTVGTIISGTWSGTAIAVAKGGTGATNAVDARTNLGLTIGTDVMAANATTTLTGDVTGTGSGTFTTTLSNSGVTAGSYGSSTAIPTLTVDSKGRITSAGTVGIIAGVNSLNYTSTTSYAAGGTISGTSLTLAAADATNPGLISTGAQTIAGTKTFNANISAPNFVGDLTGNASTATNATTATTAGNITATSNNTLTSLPNLNTVGTIISGTWSGTAIAVAKGGTGATTAADARTNLGLTIGTDVMAANATTTLAGDVTGTGSGTFTTTLSNSGVTVGSYGSSTAIPTFTVDAKGRLTAASTVGITAGVNSLNYTSATSYAAGGTISGTALTLAAADGTNPGLISTGAQVIAGAKTFSNDVTAPNFLGNAITATTAGNITATSNATLTSLTNLNTVGTITSGTWSGTTIAVANGGTGATTAADARANLGLVIGTNVMAANASTTLTGDVTGAGNGSFATTVNSIGGVNSSTISTFDTRISSNTSSITINTADIITKAPIASPAFTGTPTAPTPITSDNSTKIATTEYVKASISASSAGLSGIGAISATSNANGAVISGTTELILTPASATNGGVLTSGAQTIGGAKTFNADLLVNGLTVGRGAGNESTNIAIGSTALRVNTSGNWNTATGYQALYDNTTGALNTATGLNALFRNTTGEWNTATGVQALVTNTIGARNTSSGINSMYYNTIGNDNTAYGVQALQSNTIGNNNTAIGKSALFGNITGSNNTAIGNGADVLSAGLTNATAIGNGAIVGSDNTIKLGNAAVTSVVTSGTISATGFAGPLTGNASTATKLAATKNINGVPFDGSADITIAANAGTLTGTYLASNIVTSSLSGVGTITSGTWSGTTIAVANGGTGLTNITLGQIPFGNGTSALGTSSNLFWDNTNSRLGIGTISPTTKLEVNGSFKAGGLVYPSADGTNGQYLKTDGSGNLGFTSYINVPSYTSPNRDAGTFTNGALIYNSTTGVVQVAVPDNSNYSISNNSGNVSYWQTTYSSSTQQNVYVQTFTAPAAGNLTSVSLNLFVNSLPASAILKIYNDANPSNGLANPIATITKDVSSTSTSNIETFTLSTPYLMSANSIYTIVIYGNSSSNTFNVGTYGSNNYLGGTYYTSQANTNYSSSSDLSSIILTNFSSSDLYFNLEYQSVSSAVRWTDLLSSVNLTSNVSGSLPIANGGTGSTTASGARTNLGLGTIATKSTISDSDISSSAAIAYSKLNLTGAVTNADLSGSIAASKLVGSDIASVGTITSGTWSGTAIAIAKGGTGATTAAAARSNLGLVIGTDVMSATATTTLSGDVTGTGSGSFNTTLSSSGVIAGSYGSTTAIPTFTVDTKGRLTTAGSASIIADAGTLSGTTLKSTVTGSSLTSVGTITTGTWSGTTIAVTNGGTGVTSSTGSGSVVLSNTPTLVSPVLGAATGTSLGLTGNLNAAAGSFSSTLSAGATTLSSLTTTGAATFSGTVTIPSSAGAGKVLTSDASGVASWQNKGGSITTMSVTGNATSTASYIIFTGSTSGQTITIPSAVTLGAGRELTIKNVASVSVRIESAGGHLIQDNSTLIATSAALGIEPSNNWMKLVSDGTNWYIFRALF